MAKAALLFALVVALQSSSVIAAPAPGWNGWKPSPPAGQSPGCQITPPSWGRPKTCTVWPLPGDETDDTPEILKAFAECSNGGTVVFPEGQNYWIGTKLNPVVKDITVDWHGVWYLSDNLTYWRENAYPIAFQNHHAGFILTGDGITIDGYGTGGINGNGNAWYNVEMGTTQPGRPMPFVFWNVSEVHVSNFFVKDPPLWSLNIMNGTNLLFENINNNATAVNAPYGYNWVQNTDGFDTMDVHNVVLRNFVYQGGDDCVAIKPRSYNVLVENATCVGGNGMAIGSLGQYYDIDASVENVMVRNVTIIRYNNDLTNSAYIKCWVGVQVNQSSYESDDTSPLGPGDGGGYGNVTNITFADFLVYGASGGPTITEDSGDNGTVPGTSKLLVSNIWFQNFQGYLDGTTTEGEVSCSKLYPCYNIYYENIDLKSQENSTSYLTSGKCAYIAPGGVHGLNGTGCS